MHVKPRMLLSAVQSHALLLHQHGTQYACTTTTTATTTYNTTTTATAERTHSQRLSSYASATSGWSCLHGMERLLQRSHRPGTCTPLELPLQVRFYDTLKLVSVLQVVVVVTNVPDCRVASSRLLLSVAHSCLIIFKIDYQQYRSGDYTVQRVLTVQPPVITKLLLQSSHWTALSSHITLPLRCSLCVLTVPLYATATVNCVAACFICPNCVLLLWTTVMLLHQQAKI
jgi:hypothetical protein